jgi:hypothetical protein
MVSNQYADDPVADLVRLVTYYRLPQSNLYVQNLANDQHAGYLHEHGNGDQVMTSWVFPKDTHVIRVHNRDSQGNKNR